MVRLRLEPAVPPRLAELPGVLSVRVAGPVVECAVDAAEKRLPELLRWLVEQRVAILDCQVHEPDMEEVFVELAR
jgi:hypothetical protein